MGITSVLMQTDELSSDAMESIKLIMASSTLLLNLINNLLDVKKATAKSKKNRLEMLLVFSTFRFLLESIMLCANLTLIFIIGLVFDEQCLESFPCHQLQLQIQSRTRLSFLNPWLLFPTSRCVRTSCLLQMPSFIPTPYGFNRFS